MCISSEIFDFQILNGTLTPLKICLGHNSKNVVKGPFFITPLDSQKNLCRIAVYNL